MGALEPYDMVARNCLSSDRKMATTQCVENHGTAVLHGRSKDHYGIARQVGLEKYRVPK